MAVELTDEIKQQVLDEAISVTPNYDIDYTDARFGKVESDKQQALTQMEQTYGGMIADTDGFYDAQIQASKDWANKQTQLQQAQTDFAIEQIEQQKEQANKDYLKEQSGAYVDWQKQSNKYGTEAEKMASAGLTGTGFSESSQVSMYNTYQNRVATAKESYNKAVLNYNNAIKDARLQNNAVLAEIAYQALQQQLELSLEGFQYKNQLIIEQANKKTELDNIYYNRYQDVLQQINTENAMAEEIRQYNETQKWNTEQAEIERLFKAEEAKLDREFKAKQDEIQRNFDAAQAELDRKHDMALQEAKTKAEKEMLAQQHKNDLEKLQKQKENELAVLNQKLANDKALVSHEYSLKKSSDSSGSSAPIKQGTVINGRYKTAVNQQAKQTTKQTTNYPVNKASVMALGYGAISTTELASLVSSGQVKETIKNGQRYFDKVPLANYKYRLGM